MGHCKHVIEVPVVVSSNTAQVLVVTEIPLSPPAFKIDEIHKKIEIEDCVASCDKVIINGKLIKSIWFAVDTSGGLPGVHATNRLVPHVYETAISTLLNLLSMI